MLYHCDNQLDKIYDPVIVFSALEMLTVESYERHDGEEGHRVVCET